MKGVAWGRRPCRGGPLCVFTVVVNTQAYTVLRCAELSTRTETHPDMHTQTHARTQTHTRTRIHSHTYTHTHMHADTHRHTYIHSDTHRHTHTSISKTEKSERVGQWAPPLSRSCL